MNILLVICVTLAFTIGNAKLNEEFVRQQWMKFKNDFEKDYLTEVHNEFRYNIFMDNLNYIEEHNKKYDQGLISFKMGINQFTDKLHSEYIRETSCYNATEFKSLQKNYDPAIFKQDPIGLPEEVDWQIAGAVTTVKNQGSCGSCWAFAAVGALETRHWLLDKKLVSFSPQQLVDCTLKYPYLNKGCNGGMMQPAYKYIALSDGIVADASYPYTGVEGKCNASCKPIAARVRQIYFTDPGNELQMKQLVAQDGPIAIAVDASQKSFKQYTKGIYDEPSCSRIANHAMVIVGYGVEDGKAFWKVKNSWGKTWGDRGYIYMSRNKNNQCEIASHGIYPGTVL